MPIVRLAGVVNGKNDPNRKTRAKLLYRLFDAGWDIYNGNGDQIVTLGNIQEKIIESDAFVFMPNATLEDIFKAASIFVGFQTNDSDLEKKSAVLLNSDNSWDHFINIIEHLHKMGTVHQRYDDFLKLANKSKEVITALEESYKSRMDQQLNKEVILPHKSSDEYTDMPKPKDCHHSFNVCVFCSASIKEQEYLDAGYELGKTLADEGWGCISGAGRTGIMGQIVKGSIENGGWAAGSNVPHIIELEGLPEGLAEFWPRPDIYTRMEIMIDESDAFVIMPGGMGTVQELLALIILKEQNSYLMQNSTSEKGKSIIIVNREDANGVRFWTPLLKMLDNYGVANMFTVVNDPEEAIEAIKSLK